MGGYGREQELVLFLKKRGIAAEEMDFTHKNNVEFSHIFNDLSHGYERQMGLMRKPKNLSENAQASLRSMRWIMAILIQASLVRGLIS